MSFKEFLEYMSSGINTNPSIVCVATTRRRARRILDPLNNVVFEFIRYIVECACESKAYYRHLPQDRGTHTGDGAVDILLLLLGRFIGLFLSQVSVRSLIVEGGIQQ